MIKVTKQQAANVFWLSYDKFIDPDLYERLKKAFWRKERRVSEEEAAKGLKDRVCSIISQMETPVSVLVSGGVDSTFMLLMALECFEASKVSPCAITFQEKEFDESDNATELCCRQLGLALSMSECAPYSVGRFLSRLEPHYEEWFFSSSSVPTMEAMLSGSRHGNSILTGDGGDELFCGYDRTIVCDKLARFPDLMKKITSRCLSVAMKTERQRKLRAAFRSGYEGTVNIWPREEAEELTGVLPQGEFDRYRDEVSSLNGVSQMERFMLLDIATELYGVEVPKVETAIRMAEAVPVVSPFLDPEVMEYSCSLPLSYKYKAGVRKRLLRKTIREQAPDYKLPHKKKGFGVPVGRWFNEDDTLKRMLTKHLKEQTDPLLNQEVVLRTWRDHISGATDNTQKIWSLFMWRTLLDRGMLEIV